MIKLEKQLENKICKYAFYNDMFYHKLTSPPNGLPDRLLINKHGFMFFIEFKRKGSKPQAIQNFELKTLLEQGCYVYVVDNLEQGIKIIDDNKDIEVSYNVKPNQFTYIPK